MRVRALCVLLLLALSALPAWSAAPAAAAPSPITLADIFAPAPAPAASGSLGGGVVELACFPPCNSSAYCQSLCECSTAYCYFSSVCQKNICNCTVCP